MIQLIRAYKDERVIYAEAYDHDEYPPPLPEHERCRGLPTPIWKSRMSDLAVFGGYDKVTVTSIYLPK